MTWNESGKPNAVTQFNEAWSSGGLLGYRVGVGFFDSDGLFFFGSDDDSQDDGFGLGALRKV